MSKAMESTPQGARPLARTPASTGTKSGPRARVERLLVLEKGMLKEHDQVSHASSAEISAPSLIWRERVVQWCYDVADHIGESRSVVYVAMNILDRFGATQSSEVDERNYEVASMTAFFLAIRIWGSGSLRIEELRSMSRAGINIKEIVAMGTSMVEALTWNHRLVTPLDFVRCFMELLPCESDFTSQVIMESACYLIEIAVCDVSLSHCKPSEVAAAAMMNALRACRGSEAASFGSNLRRTFGINPDSSTMSSLCARLDGMYSQSADNGQYSSPHIIEDEDAVAPVHFRRSSVLPAVSVNDFDELKKCESGKRRSGDGFEASNEPLKRMKYDLSSMM